MICPPRRSAPARALLLAVLAAGLFGGIARGGENVVVLARQYGFGTKRGFALWLENKAPEPRTAATMKLVLTLGDGKAARAKGHTEAWEPGRLYRVRAVLHRDRAEWFLDDRALGAFAAPWEPQPAPLAGGGTLQWAGGKTEYRVVVASLSVRQGADGPAFAAPLADPTDTLPPRLAALYPNAEGQWPWKAAAAPSGDGILYPVTVETSFRLLPPAGADALLPLVDRYGQVPESDAPGKIAEDADFAARRADEERRLAALEGEAGPLDDFGGLRDAPWTSEATGRYRVERRPDGFWWLVTPEGKPCFFTGISNLPDADATMTPATGRESLFAQLPPREGPTAGLWHEDPWRRDGKGSWYFAPQGWNLIRKYGPADWKTEAVRQGHRRLAAAGFSGAGKWGELFAKPGVPEPRRRCASVVHVSEPALPRVAGRWDVFAPGAEETWKNHVARQLAPLKDNPWVLGYSVGNEKRMIVTPAEIRGMLAAAPGTPAREALVDHALRVLYGDDAARLAKAWKVEAETAVPAAEAVRRAPKLEAPDGDVKLLRRWYQGRFYAFLRDGVKAADPGRPYFGQWLVPGWWEEEEDWDLHAEYCDVLGLDIYEDTPTSRTMLDRYARSGKPVLIGEFGFPPFYAGRRGLGRFRTSTADDADAADRYARYVRAAAENPYCVGTIWFEYRDQPVTGRGPGKNAGMVAGEHYAFGIVDLADNPKWDLIAGMRAANHAAASWRLAAAREQ